MAGSIPDTALAPRIAKSSKFTSLEAGRAFAALMVVLFHCNLTASLATNFGYQPLTFFRGGYGGVEFFFVLSGFVMVVAHRKDLVSGRRSGRFLWKRFQRLYPMLWAVVLPLVALMIVVPSRRWAGSLSIGDVIAAITVCPYPQDRVLAVEWTLRYEIVFYLLFAMTIRWRRPGLTLWLVWGVIGMTSLISTPTGLLGFFAMPYPLLFAAGAVVGLTYQRIRLGAAIASLTIGGTIFLAWLAHVATIAVNADKATPLDVLTAGAGSALILAGLAGLEHLGKIVAPRFLCFLGAASYSIYLVHYPAINPFMTVAMKLRALGLPDYAALAFVLIAAIGTGVLCHLVVEKPLLKAMKRIDDRYQRTRHECQ